MILLPAVTLLVLGAAFMAATWYGGRRWNAETVARRKVIARAQEAVLPSTYSPDQLATLPAPVQRYFAVVLPAGQPIITRAHIQHRGTFNMREASKWWRPFSSDQLVVLNRPGFDWNAQITLLPRAASSGSRLVCGW